MKISDLVIREETPKDYPKVYNLNSEVFHGGGEAQLVDKLRSGNTFADGLSMVATINNDIVGHILFSKINIVSGDKKHPSLALAPMAVLSKYQGTGIGSELVKEGLKRAKALNYESVIVLGHETFYPRFGFTPANKWGIKAPFNIPEKSFMALELKEGVLQEISGVVEYPTEFDCL